MSAWPDAVDRLFNPAPQVRVLQLGGGRLCLVVDDALVDPQAAVDWARRQPFEEPRGFPYPGQVLAAPPTLAARMTEFFALHLRGPLGARRTLAASVRMAMVTTPPAALSPVQWQCHRDRLGPVEDGLLLAASVLYLFRDPAQGGTSFYAPKVPLALVDRMVLEAQTLDARTYAERYGLTPGYMVGDNDYFERVAQVPARWNRLIAYDGGLFHTGDIGDAARLNPDPALGRLTMNGFFTCRRRAA
ncbi:MAG: hypothetical protein KGL18_16165 [Burkholderiales bacterium]|nr:hypothetical protein [Burkholderiales bacterium]MDE1926612.1 hypothetical protein [Burkholderiales bacterium]MDE2158844.1 hypothetical protein [Burkholderiales bacterium]MDE2504500.1 hypothetical protein [Burkholderiales bacterium]